MKLEDKDAAVAAHGVSGRLAVTQGAWQPSLRNTFVFYAYNFYFRFVYISSYFHVMLQVSNILSFIELQNIKWTCILK